MQYGSYNGYISCELVSYDTAQSHIFLTAAKHLFGQFSLMFLKLIFLLFVPFPADSDSDPKRQYVRSFSRLFVTIPQGAGLVL
jgi:hypothetical protein